MKVGNLSIDPDVLLAPMAAVTDLPFRTICEQQGLGLTITEFLSANALCDGIPKIVDKMTASLDGRRFGVQIFGREPEKLAQAARMAHATGASLVDINMGCPAKRVVAGACGSALMREVDLAQSLVRVVRDALPTSIPVTVKHRAGWDDKHLNAPEFACALVEAGAAMITVHGRTRAQGFSGTVNHEIIGKVRAALPFTIPVIGNGDVKTLQDYIRMRENTGCDAIMIGRGAMGNPWLFREIQAYLRKEDPPAPPSMDDRLAIFRQHVALMKEHTEPKRTIHEIRKAVAWYTKGLPHSAELREKMMTVADPSLLIAEAEAFFTWMKNHEKS